MCPTVFLEFFFLSFLIFTLVCKLPFINRLFNNFISFSLSFFPLLSVLNIRATPTHWSTEIAYKKKYSPLILKALQCLRERMANYGPPFGNSLLSGWVWQIQFWLEFPKKIWEIVFLALKRPLYICTLWYVALATGRGVDFTIPVPDPGILSPFPSLCPPLPRFLTGYFFTLHPRLKRVTGIRTEKRTLHCSTKDQMQKLEMHLKMPYSRKI